MTEGKFECSHINIAELGAMLKRITNRIWIGEINVYCLEESLNKSSSKDHYAVSWNLT